MAKEDGVLFIAASDAVARIFTGLFRKKTRTSRRGSIEPAVTAGGGQVGANVGGNSQTVHDLE
jgi:hypothetical protein